MSFQVVNLVEVFFHSECEPTYAQVFNVRYIGRRGLLSVAVNVCKLHRESCISLLLPTIQTYIKILDFDAVKKKTRRECNYCQTNFVVKRIKSAHTSVLVMMMMMIKMNWSATAAAGAIKFIAVNQK